MNMEHLGVFCSITSPNTNMTMEQPFEDVSPIKDGDFPAFHGSFRGGKNWLCREISLKSLKSLDFLKLICRYSYFRTTRIPPKKFNHNSYQQPIRSTIYTP